MMPAKIGPKKTFRHFIVEHREAKNLTQEQLADRLDCDVMTVSRWENYKTRVDLPILAAIAEALGGNLEAEDLLHHPDEPTPNQLLRRLPAEDQRQLIKQIKGLLREA